MLQLILLLLHCSCTPGRTIRLKADAKAEDAGDLNNNTSWFFTFGDTGEDYLHSIAVGPSSAIYLRGAFEGTIDFGSRRFSAGRGMHGSGFMGDHLLGKIYPNGSLSWGIQISRSSQAFSIDKAGSITLSGHCVGYFRLGKQTFHCPTTWADVWLVRYSPDGELVWVNTFGGKGRDLAGMPVADGAGGVWVNGTFEQTMDIGNTTLSSRGKDDFYVVHLDEYGVPVFATSAGGPMVDQSLWIDRLVDGSLVLGGNFQDKARFGGIDKSSAGKFDGFIGRFLTRGVFSWITTISGKGDDYIGAVVSDTHGGVYALGSFMGQATLGTFSMSAGDPNKGAVFIARIDSSGSVRWVKVLDQALDPSAIHARGDKVAIAGCLKGQTAVGSHTLTSAGGCDAFVAVMDSSGAFQSAFTAGGPGFDHASDVVLQKGGILVAGSFSETAHFDGIFRKSKGKTDAFLWFHPL